MPSIDKPASSSAASSHKPKALLRIETAVKPSAIEPVPIPNARYGPFGYSSSSIPPDSPPLTAPVCTEDDYELLDHLKNDTITETIATIQSTFLWDGIYRGRFLSFPHLALHGDAQTSHIMRVLEQWLSDKLMQPQLGDHLPILEDSIPDSCHSIMALMHQEKHLMRPFHTCLIQIRSGHLYNLPLISNGNTFIDVDEFIRDYPLFVDVCIKIVPRSFRPSKNTAFGDAEHCRLLLSFETIVGKSDEIEKSQPYLLSELVDITD
ncbi:hypothetical protein BGW37DRAFT_483904 [Umbelopsis sp. PMI_123]|nr:hypothetical protein BGW37DRAFT_483904 [Umbelopsis sp. PMI_123]